MSLIMPLDICIESYGAAVHVVDSLLSSGFYLGARRRSSQPVAPESASFDRLVQSASAELPFSEAQAVWLVDVCHCSYDEAAHEAHTSRDEIAIRVAAGRMSIRSAIAAELVAANR